MFESLLQQTSDVPLLALVAEGMALIVYLSLSVQMGLKFREKRRRATFFLFMSFLFYIIAISFLFGTKATDFLTNDLFAVADLGINLGYSFSLVGNLFLFYFTLEIFYEEPKEFLRYTLTFANGITFGFLMIFIFQVQSFPFLELPATYIPPHLLIWHVIVSSVGFLILFQQAWKARGAAEESLPRAGFFMISLSALFELLVFVFFFVDRFSGGGFTIWYFMAWLSASLAGICSMTGYLIPRPFRWIVSKL